MKAKTVIKRIIAGIVFLVLISAAIFFAGRIVHPENTESGPGFEMWDGFYAEDNNTLNALFIGSSAIFRYWIAPQAYEEQGFTSYMLASESQLFSTTPYIMREALSSQDVDLFVVETRKATYFSELNYADEETVEKTNKQYNFFLSEIASGMKFSPAKVEMVDDFLVENENNKKLEWDISLLKYHDNYLKFENSVINDRLMANKDEYKSAYQISVVRSYEHILPEYDESYVLCDEDKANIDKIVRTAEKLGKKVLFISTPYVFDDMRYSLQLQLNEYIAEKGYDMLYCEDHLDEMGLDYSTDFYNKRHTNAVGAKKVTSFVAEYLKENYDFKDRLNDRQKKEWLKASKDWNEYADILAAEVENNYKAIKEKEG